MLAFALLTLKINHPQDQAGSRDTMPLSDCQRITLSHAAHLKPFIQRRCRLALIFCISSLTGLPALSTASTSHDQDGDHAGHHHAKPVTPSRLLKPGVVLPARIAPATALNPKAKVVLVDAVEDQVEAPKQTAAVALPAAVAPRISLLPQAPFKPVAIVQ